MKEFSVQPYLTDILILTETAEQIKKDLSFFALPITFSGNKETAYNELFNQVEPHIKQLLDRDYEKLLSLMYRIDINEKELTRNTEHETSKHLTDLVIKRCLQKVILRRLYSK